MKPLLLLSLLIASGEAWTQTLEITYLQRVSFTGKKTNYDTGDLKISGNYSLYSLRLAPKEKTKAENADFLIDLSGGMQFQSLLNMVTDERQTRDYVFTKPYLIKEKDIRLAWIITTEKKKIGGYLATRATTEFRGRKYECWFTADIPLNTGPWKLSGLPGLILEANDVENEIGFQLIKIRTHPADSRLEINAAGILKTITWDEFRTLYNQKLISLKKLLYAKSGGADYETIANIIPNTIEKTLFQ
jgi:GLPGLI family protein